MKKMMAALMGIAVLFLASCKTEPTEVLLTNLPIPTEYNYQMDLTGNVVSKTKYGATETTFTLNGKSATVSWIENPTTKTNIKEYSIKCVFTYTDSESNTQTRTQNLTVIKYKDEYYINNIDDGVKITVEGSPESNEFTVKYEEKTENGSYSSTTTANLKFTR